MASATLTAASLAVSGTALVTTLYLNLIRERRLRPALSVTLDTSSTHDLMTFDFPKEPGKAEHWLRLRVHNERNRRTAEDVEVLFAGCRSSDGGPPLPLDARHVRWSATADIKSGVDALARDAPEPKCAITIPPGFSRRVDLLHVSNREKVEADCRGVPRVCTWPSSSHRNELSPGRYTFFLAVTARDANAVFYKLRVRYEGGFSTTRDYWVEHLIVGEPEAIDALPDEL